MTPPTELEVLVEQLDELLVDGAHDGDEALEIATVAGLAARLGADEITLAPAETWRDGPGADLLSEGFEEVDVDELVETIDGLIDGEADDELVEEAVGDFDDLVAAAAWTGRADWIRPAARRVAGIVRQIPDPFAFLAEDGKTMAKTPTVGADPDLYDYWLAIAEAGEWAS